MILFLGHGPRPRTNPNAAGGVALGWVPLVLFLRFAQHVGLNSPDFIFAFWGSVAWVPLISFYFSGVQPHLGVPHGDFNMT